MGGILRRRPGFGESTPGPFFVRQSGRDADERANEALDLGPGFFSRLAICLWKIAVEEEVAGS